MTDLINSPPHYTHGPIEVIDLIELFKLDYNEGNALKYLLRWRHKGGTESLEKCIWYLNRIIAVAKKGPGSTAPRGLQEELSRTRRFSGEDPESVVTPQSLNAHPVQGAIHDWEMEGDLT